MGGSGGNRERIDGPPPRTPFPALSSRPSPLGAGGADGAAAAAAAPRPGDPAAPCGCGAARCPFLRPPRPRLRPRSPLLFSTGFRSALPQLFLITQHFCARTLPGPDRRRRCFPVPPPLSRRPRVPQLCGDRSISAPGDPRHPEHPDPTAEHGPLVAPRRCCRLSPGTHEATRGAAPHSRLCLSAHRPHPAPAARGAGGRVGDPPHVVPWSVGTPGAPPCPPCWWPRGSPHPGGCGRAVLWVHPLLPPPCAVAQTHGAV